MIGLGTIINVAAIVAGALEGMMSVSEGSLVSGKTLLIISSIALGALIGGLCYGVFDSLCWSHGSSRCH